MAHWFVKPGAILLVFYLLVVSLFPVSCSFSDWRFHFAKLNHLSPPESYQSVDSLNSYPPAVSFVSSLLPSFCSGWYFVVLGLSLLFLLFISPFLSVIVLASPFLFAVVSKGLLAQFLASFVWLFSVRFLLEHRSFVSYFVFWLFLVPFSFLIHGSLPWLLCLTLVAYWFVHVFVPSLADWRKKSLFRSFVFLPYGPVLRTLDFGLFFFKFFPLPLVVLNKDTDFRYLLTNLLVMASFAVDWRILLNASLLVAYTVSDYLYREPMEWIIPEGDPLGFLKRRFPKKQVFVFLVALSFWLQVLY